ncbi:sialic acid synthase [Ochlerotatus camptorhynchus]|uniref:sialic acid synthase n=1 Tax=Ochlerotatus camptorhynchus TaxID=644619 RepID=UPI0031D33F7F
MNISGTLVGDGHPVFIIAEIGQNHQGSLEIAKQMILKAKELGVDCVKFQKSCLQAKFTVKALERQYTGPHSWGTTYGEHKSYLEFSIDDYRSLQQFCSEIGILFTASAMDPISFQQLIQLKVPFVKIGSGDADNLPMLRQAALADNIPLIVSTGMQSWNQVQQIHQILRENSTALLHCISAYPTPPEEACLNLIPLYKEHFPELLIGYSGHELGLQITVASILLGARIVERHFTLDKGWKGTDHKASLNPAEFGRLVKYIRMVENVKCARADVPKMLSEVLQDDDFNREELARALKPVTVDDRKLMTSEIACHSKLGKSLVFGSNVEAGHALEWTDVAVKVSEPRGLSPTWFDRIVGRTVVHPHRMDEPIVAEDLVPV